MQNNFISYSWFSSEPSWPEEKWWVLCSKAGKVIGVLVDIVHKPAHLNANMVSKVCCGIERVREHLKLIRDVRTPVWKIKIKKNPI